MANRVNSTLEKYTVNEKSSEIMQKSSVKTFGDLQKSSVKRFGDNSKYSERKFGEKVNKPKNIG